MKNHLMSTEHFLYLRGRPAHSVAIRNILFHGKATEKCIPPSKNNRPKLKIQKKQHSQNSKLLVNTSHDNVHLTFKMCTNAIINIFPTLVSSNAWDALTSFYFP